MFLENTVWPLSVSEMGVCGEGLNGWQLGPGWRNGWMLFVLCTLKERPIYLFFFHVLAIELRMSLERIGQMVTTQPHLYPKRYIPPTHFTTKAGATIMSMAASVTCPSSCSVLWFPHPAPQSPIIPCLAQCLSTLIPFAAALSAMLFPKCIGTPSRKLIS